jgi:hypothetical protein
LQQMAYMTSQQGITLINWLLSNIFARKKRLLHANIQQVLRV